MRRLLLWLLLSLLACAADPSELAPDEALRAFLGALERSTHSPEQRRAAYDFLAAESQRKLAERARLAASLGGRAFEPWELLVPARSSFAAQRGAGSRLATTIEGARAHVQLASGEGAAEDRVELVREGGRWRVVLSLPP